MLSKMMNLLQGTLVKQQVEKSFDDSYIKALTLAKEIADGQINYFIALMGNPFATDKQGMAKQIMRLQSQIRQWEQGIIAAGGKEVK